MFRIADADAEFVRFVNHVLRPEAYHFQWQRGYGYLSLGQGQLAQAVSYVLQQKEHHAAQTTNRWLEWISEENDGPSNENYPIAPIGAVREGGAAYHVDTDWPF